MDSLTPGESLIAVERATDIVAGSRRLAEVVRWCRDRIFESDAAARTWADIDTADMPAEGGASLYAGRRLRHDAGDASLPALVLP